MLFVIHLRKGIKGKKFKKFPQPFQNKKFKTNGIKYEDKKSMKETL